MEERSTASVAIACSDRVGDGVAWGSRPAINNGQTILKNPKKRDRSLKKIGVLFFKNL